MILLWDKTDQSPVANAQQAEHYIQRKTMQVFIHTRRQIEDSIGYQYGWKSAQWFVVYMLLNLWLYKAGGDGALYTDAHDEPQAYAAGQTYLPDAMLQAGIHFYQPNRRGFEIKFADKLEQLRALDAAATVNKTGEKP